MKKLIRFFTPIPDPLYLAGFCMVLTGCFKLIYQVAAQPGPLSFMMVPPPARGDTLAGAVRAWLVSTLPDFVMMGVVLVIIGLAVMTLRRYEYAAR